VPRGHARGTASSSPARARWQAWTRVAAKRYMRFLKPCFKCFINSLRNILK
jgi:hypothetical protein